MSMVLWRFWIAALSTKVYLKQKCTITIQYIFHLIIHSEKVQLEYSILCFPWATNTRITSNIYTKDKDFNEVTGTRNKDNQKNENLRQEVASVESK